MYKNYYHDVERAIHREVANFCFRVVLSIETSINSRINSCFRALFSTIDLAAPLQCFGHVYLAGDAPVRRERPARSRRYGWVVYAHVVRKRAGMTVSSTNHLSAASSVSFGDCGGAYCVTLLLRCC